MATATPPDVPVRRRRRRYRETCDPAMLARHTAALKLLRKGIETDGALLLSYVVWPSAQEHSES